MIPNDVLGYVLHITTITKSKMKNEFKLSRGYEDHRGRQIIIRQFEHRLKGILVDLT